MINKYSSEVETFKKVNKELQTSLKEITDEKYKEVEEYRREIDRLNQLNQTVIRDIEALQREYNWIQN